LRIYDIIRLHVLFVKKTKKKNQLIEIIKMCLVTR
jgi:hypothetical protein